VVPLPTITVRELRAWRAVQNQERPLQGAEWADHGFVFTTTRGTPLDDSNLHRGSFRRIMEAARLGSYVGDEPCKPRRGPTPKRIFKPAFSVYALRHSHASLLLMDGESLLVVSRRLGPREYPTHCGHLQPRFAGTP